MDKAPKLELLSVFLKSIVLLNLKKVFFMVCVEKGKKIEDDSAYDSNRKPLFTSPAFRFGRQPQDHRRLLPLWDYTGPAVELGEPTPAQGNEDELEI